MNPKVSIIVPLYNRAKLVKETIQSVLDQSYPHWELITIDDGSTDGSEAVAKAFVEQDERVKIHYRHREPKGAPTCRNIGLERSTGKYVIFLDSDDLLAPWCLEERMRCYKENTHSDFLVFGQLSFTRKPGDSNVLWNILDKPKEDLLRFFQEDTPWQTSSVIWKRDSLLSINGWNENARDWQDCDLHIRAILNNFSYQKFDLLLPDNFIRRDTQVVNMSLRFTDPQRISDRLRLIWNLFSSNDAIYRAKTYQLAVAQYFFYYTEVSLKQGRNVINSLNTYRIIDRLSYVKKLEYLSSLIYLFLSFFLDRTLIGKIPKAKAFLFYFKKVFLKRLSGKLSSTKLNTQLQEMRYSNVLSKLDSSLTTKNYDS